MLAPLDEVERRAVLAASVRRRYRSGDTIFHQGDVGNSLHLLERGHVLIQFTDLNGTLSTFDVVHAGSSFGELSLVGTDLDRSASAVAVGAVETRTLSRQAFDDLRSRHPAVTALLVELLADRVRRLSDQLVDARSLSAEDRTLKALVTLACGFADADGEGALIPITQEEIASLAGTTRPTANRAIQALAADGLAEIARGRIIVPDRRALERRAGRLLR